MTNDSRTAYLERVLCDGRASQSREERAYLQQMTAVQESARSRKARRLAGLRACSSVRPSITSARPSWGPAPEPQSWVKASCVAWDERERERLVSDWFEGQVIPIIYMSI